MKNLVLETMNDTFFNKSEEKTYANTRNTYKTYYDTNNFTNNSISNTKYSETNNNVTKIKDLKISFLVKDVKNNHSASSRNPSTNGKPTSTLNTFHNYNKSHIKPTGKNFLSKNLEIDLQSINTERPDVNSVNILNKINSPSISLNSKNKLKELMNLNRNFSKSTKITEKNLTNFKNLQLITKATTPKKNEFFTAKSI